VLRLQWAHLTKTVHTAQLGCEFVSFAFGSAFHPLWDGKMNSSFMPE